MKKLCDGDCFKCIHPDCILPLATDKGKTMEGESRRTKNYQVSISVDGELYEKWLKYQEIIRGYKRSRYTKVSIMAINSELFAKAIQEEMRDGKAKRK